MSRTPAAHLARLKVQYPQWSVRAVRRGKGTGYTAHRRDGRGGLRRVYAPSLVDPENALAKAEAKSGR